jgi:hypothetical protein
MIPVLKRVSSYVPPGNPLFYYINEFALLSGKQFEDGLYVSYVNIHSNLPRYKPPPLTATVDANGSYCCSSGSSHYSYINNGDNGLEKKQTQSRVKDSDDGVQR